MPGTLTFSGATYPLAAEANDVPADLLRFGNDIDDLLVLKATDEADRNSRYANTPAGTLVSCAAIQTVWMKLTTPPTAASWAVLIENPAAVTTGVATAGANFTITTQWGQRRNGFVSIYVGATYTSATEIVGDPETASNPSNIINTTIATLGAAWRPPHRWATTSTSLATGAFGVLETAGTIILMVSTPSGRIRTGDLVEVSATFPAV